STPRPGQPAADKIVVYQDEGKPGVPALIDARVTAHATGPSADYMFALAVRCGSQFFVKTTNVVGHAPSTLHARFVMRSAAACQVVVQSGHGHGPAETLEVDAVSVRRLSVGRYWTQAYDAHGYG